MAGNGTHCGWHHHSRCARLLVHHIPRQHLLQHPLCAGLQHPYVPMCHWQYSHRPCLDAEGTDSWSCFGVTDGRTCQQCRKYSCCRQSTWQALHVDLSGIHYHWCYSLWLWHRLPSASRVVHDPRHTICCLSRGGHQPLLLSLHSPATCAFISRTFPLAPLRRTQAPPSSWN